MSSSYKQGTSGMTLLNKQAQQACMGLRGEGGCALDSRFMYRKEDDGHKRPSSLDVIHVTSMFVWKELSFTRLEECTREVQGRILGSAVCSDCWDGSL